MIALILTLLVSLASLAGTASAPAPPTDLPRDGTVRLRVPTRAGVTGDCAGTSVDLGHGAWLHRGRAARGAAAPGPALVTLVLRDGALRRVDLAVGACADAEGEARTADPAATAAWLLAQAPATRPAVAEDALAAAVLLDAPVPRDPLLALARDRGLDTRVRAAAVHWLGVLAGAAVSAPLDALAADPDEDLDLREHAVFALARLDDPDALAHLLDIGRAHPAPRLRRAALLALAERDDPRVLALYEEILEAR